MKKITLTGLVIIAIYAVLGFIYAPSKIKSLLKQITEQQTGQVIEFDDISFNPLTFSLTLDHITITDDQGAQWFKANSLATNFNPTSLLWGNYDFSYLQLEAPQMTMAVSNSDELQQPSFSLPAQSNTDSTIKLNIDDIGIDQGQIHLSANNIKENFALDIQSLSFKKRDFNLGDVDATFELNFSTRANETVQIDGVYNHQNASIKATWEIDDIDLKAWQQALPDDIMNVQGLANADGQIDWELLKKPQIKINELTLQDLALNWLNQLQLSDWSISAEHIDIDSNESFVDAQLLTAESGSLALSTPFQLQEETGNSKDPENLWRWKLAQFNWHQTPLTWQYDAWSEPLQLVLEQLHISSINNQQQNSEFSLHLKGANDGSIKSTGQFNLNTTIANAQVNTDDWPLSPHSPLLSDLLGFHVDQGHLQLSQDISISGESIIAEGQAQLNDLVLNNTSGQNLATIDQLSLQGTSLNSQERLLHLGTITLNQANGQLLLDPQGQLNLPQKEAEDAADKNITQPSIEPAWRITFGDISVNDSSTTFTDQSIQPEVKTELSAIQGTIKGLQADQAAQVDIKGQLNQFAPLTLNGEFDLAGYMDLKLSVDHLDLLGFSSYAARTLDFPITQGQVDIKLNYNLNEKRIDGSNQLLFKQLKLGNKQNNPDALSVPLKLAQSILTNNKNEMPIDLKVSGDLQDPNFSMSGLISKAFIKLITGLVTSPFKILGKLIPNPEPQMNEIFFTDGSSELAESEQNKLAQIAQIMQQKTKLKLAMQINSNREKDSQALKQKQLLSRSPIRKFNINHPEFQAWIESQFNTQQSHEFINNDAFDHSKAWQQLIDQEIVNNESLKLLQNNRLEATKQHLLEVLSVAPERVFFKEEVLLQESGNKVVLTVDR